jgi:hypothetical protein
MQLRRIELGRTVSWEKRGASLQSPELPIVTPARMARLPELPGNRQRLDAGLLLPADLIAGLMQVALMRAADGHGQRRLEFSAQM